MERAGAGGLGLVVGEVGDLAGGDGGALADLGVGGVAEVGLGFGSVLDEEAEPDFDLYEGSGVVGVAADPFEGEVGGGEGVGVFVEDGSPDGVVLDGVLDEHSEHGGW